MTAKKPRSEHLPPGRPTVYSDDILSKLEEAFKADFKDEEACSHAGISTTTFYRWLNEVPGFREKIEAAKEWLFKIARKQLAKGVVEGTISPLELLDRRDRKRYSKQTNTEQETKVVVVDAQKVKAMDPQQLFDALRAAGIGSKE